MTNLGRALTSAMVALGIMLLVDWVNYWIAGNPVNTRPEYMLWTVGASVGAHWALNNWGAP